MQSRVKWVEGMTFLGQSSSGHSVVMDGNGGDKAPSPMELVLMAAGGCSSVDVVEGLKSAGQKLQLVRLKFQRLVVNKRLVFLHRLTYILW